LLIATPAMAMWDWCDVDPILDIDGHTVSIDASVQGDPQQICGDIVFSVSVPRGTPVSVIYCEPNARVKINYNSSYNSNSCDEGERFSRHEGLRGIPVSVSVDINSKAKFNTRVIVTVDGEQVAQDQETTRGKLSCSFTIR
jgi:hypothetical protein